MLLALVGHLLLSQAPGVANQAVAPPSPSIQVGPPPPAPKFEIEPFRFLLGRWRGEGVFGFSGAPVSSVMTFELANRTTLVLHAAEDTPNTYRYVALWSREKESDALLMLMSSSLDGPALYRSDGWVGDKLVFEPKAGVNTGPSRVRFTYLRKSPQSFELTYEFSVNGEWMLGDRQTFTKME